MMLEENKNVVRQFEEAGNNPRDLEAIWNSFAPDCQFTFMSRQLGHPCGLEDYKPLLLKYFEALPDAVFTIEDMVAEEDKVWFRLNIQGTHSDVLRGIQATGKRVSYTQIGMFRVRNGRIIEADSYFDDLTLLKQLGVSTIA